MANDRNISVTARALNLHRSTVQESIRLLKRRAAAQGYSPDHDMVHTVPEPFVVRGLSTYYNKEGRPTGQWVKSRLEDEQFQELVREGVRAFYQEHGEIEVPDFPHMDFDRDVIPWIQIGDAHIGMLANEAEAGANFNCEIAEREICAAFRLIFDALPPCERIVINDLGDSTHFENTEKKTAASRHDLDGERPKMMIRAISRIMRFIVDLALTKARSVDVIINQGNHSRFGDFWLAETLEVAYAASGRVNVIDNENVFIGYRMGETLVMVHHSDKCRPDDLPGVMMASFKEDFAETKFHYIDIGHIHHKMTSKERNGVVVESWNTLARGDKWHHDKGYRARQSMSVVFRSRTYGEVGRRVLPIEMVWDAVQKGHSKDGVSYKPTPRRAFSA